MRRTLAVLPLALSSAFLLVPAALGQAPSPPPDHPDSSSRWIVVQAVTVNALYRHSVGSNGSTDFKQLRHKEFIRGSFKFDPEGRFSLVASVSTGAAFNSGFANTGIGNGHAATNLFVKQLYVSARPLAGVELQYGGIGYNRGAATEITTFDNDAYLVGERVTVTRPKSLFFDEICVTYGYLGDLAEPSVFARLHRLNESNYHQFLVSKSIGKRAVISTDYTFLAGAETLRQAVRVNAAELRVVDSVRFENYQRVDEKPDYGFAVAGEKALDFDVTVGGGFASIDPDYGTGLNADFFPRGKRLFAWASWKLSPEFSAKATYGRAVGDGLQAASRNRFDVVLSYDVLAAIRKAFGH